MADKEKKYLMLLRVFLVSAAIAWGVSLAGLVLPWAMVEKELGGYGATLPMDDVMVQYWLKMAAAVYTLMGCFFIMVAIWPIKYRPVIKLIGLLHVILGVVFLINGLMLDVDAIPLYVDVSFCFCIGVGILSISRKLPSDLS
jgi:hypothetical protein